MMILSFYIVPWYMLYQVSTLMLDVSYAVEVLVFMFAGGVRFHTSVVFLIHTWYSNSSCSCLSYLFLVSPHVVGIGSGYFVVYLLCVYMLG